MRNIDYIVLHCTATAYNAKVSSIMNFWRNTLGWNNPGYNFLIEANGHVVQLADISRVTNGVKGYNSNSIHIAYIGGVENGKAVDNRTCKQREAMETLVRKYHSQFPKAKILGHRDLSPDLNGDGIIQPWEWTKECPSFTVADWLKEIGL